VQGDAGHPSEQGGGLKKNNQKKWRAEEEERQKGSLTTKKKKNSLTVASRADTRPPNPTRGFDLAASPIDVAAKLNNTINATFTHKILETKESISGRGPMLYDHLDIGRSPGTSFSSLSMSKLFVLFV
jgi:hypothetical protein